MHFTFSDLLDVQLLNKMAEQLYKMAGIPVGIIGLDGTIYVRAGWQDICTKFHRVHPETCRQCDISDAYIKAHLQDNTFVEYKCLNNIWDTAMPIKIANEHVATLFVGQYFYNDEEVDENFFREQAKKYDFEEEAYLGALHRVPRFTKEQIRQIMDYYNMYIQVIAESGLRHLEMKEIHDSLEVKVEERTKELVEINQELIATNDTLTYTLDRLNHAQHQLIESEKMAALGGLVAGMSHEISTPIGNAVMGVSCIQKEIKEMELKCKEKKIVVPDVNESITDIEELVEMSLRNLERTDFLIRSFKQISADQVNEEKRRFRVKQYLEDLVFSLGPVITKKGHRVSINCEENLEITSYPGGFAQIITNLITNSVRHGFEDRNEGHIEIEMKTSKSGYQLLYKDDGYGMTKDTLEHIYEPFFTTKRGNSGSTGLGMHIVYNIVRQTLGGEITCTSEPQKGVCFDITFDE